MSARPSRTVDSASVHSTVASVAAGASLACGAHDADDRGHKKKKKHAPCKTKKSRMSS